MKRLGATNDELRPSPPLRRRACFSVVLAGLLAGCAPLTAAQRADKDDRLGEEDLTAEKPCRALAKFERAVAEAPDDWAALRHAVDAARRCGKLTATLARARAAVASEPDSPRAHYWLGLALLASDRGEKAGLDELATAHRLDATSGELALRLGVALLDAEHFGDAIAPLREAVAHSPGEAHPHFPLAVALHRTGQDAAAIAELTDALQASPSAADLKAARTLLDRIHDPYRAIPPAARGRFSEGMGWLERSEAPQRAIDIFEELQADHPQLAALQAALGLGYQRMGDTAQAVEHFERASQLDPLLPEPHLYLGELYYDLRRYEQAGGQYRAALAQDPFLEAARERLAQLALEQGDAQTAAEQMRALVALREGDVNTRLALTEALSLVGDLKGAEAQLKIVLDQEPKNLGAKLALGTLDARRAGEARSPEERGRWAREAKKLLGEVLANQPDNAAASRLMASLDKH